MSRYIHSLTATLFYLLAGSFFLAYVLLRNNVGGGLPGTWLRIGDLPLIFTAMLYGGLSVYRSLTADGAPSLFLSVVIALPLLVLFVLFLVLNFWTVVAG